MVEASHMVVVGQFAGTHGVRGAFKIRSFTENPVDVAAYGSVTTKTGLKLTLSLVREMKPGLFLVTAPEISSPEDGEAFKGAVLQVERELLPDTEEDEFYLNDLVGLKAQTIEGEPAGMVKAVLNFGAGDLIELSQIPGRKGSEMISFTKTDVPQIDLSGGLITVILPDENNGEERPDDA